MTLQELEDLRNLCEQQGEDRSRAQLEQGWWHTPEERACVAEWLLKREKIRREEEITRQRVRDDRVLNSAETSAKAAESAARWAAIATFLAVAGLFIEKIVLRIWASN